MWIYDIERKNQSKIRLYCFHHAGGSARSFYDWKPYLPDNIDLCAIELPGRGNRAEELLPTSVEEIVESLAEEITKDTKGIQFGFFGHSMGGLLAVAMTEFMERNTNRVPMWLGISSFCFTQLHNSKKRNKKHQLNNEQFTNYIESLDTDISFVDGNEDLQRKILPIIREDIKITENCALNKNLKVSCPISVFIGLEDPTINRNTVEMWAFKTLATLKRRQYQGGHHFLFDKSQNIPNDVFDDFLASIDRSL